MVAKRQKTSNTNRTNKRTRLPKAFVKPHKKAQKLRVAVVHDWLTGMRGGEVVLESLLDLFPDADLYTLLYKKGSVSEKITNRKIYTSFIDTLPFKNRFYRHYLPFFPLAIESFSFQKYDLVFSSSHCVARGVLVPPGVVHISYFHSPMRYVWDMRYEYFPPKGLINRLIIPWFTHYLRMWDYAARDRVDCYICNSRFVARRIERFYNKTARVVAPPCLPDKTAININSKRKDYYLVLSALVPYKRIDQAVQVFRKMPDRKLVVVGTGPELKALQAMASENVAFKGRVEHEQLQQYYQEAQALLFPGKEDFGIVPVEAQAQGCPVIAYGQGGVLETVIDNKTGILYNDQTVPGLYAAIQQHEKTVYKANDFIKNAGRFTDTHFKNAIRNNVKEFFPDW